jgi:hypothetical protein
MGPEIGCRPWFPARLGGEIREEREALRLQPNFVEAHNALDFAFNARWDPTRASGPPPSGRLHLQLA